ncbi:MAG TPA: VWA domain-containing protein [Pyrinomonadaceae bacterium]|nr:VWA domain-containing protein [Pyrinomonadaceae bacterium]
MKEKIFLILCLLLPFCFVSNTVAQDKSKAASEDIVRVDTRVVFVDVSVKDQKTNAPVRDLSLKNFQVFDDGKPRELTYFSREGETRRPLSLLILIDLWTTYGRKYIKQQAVMQRLADALRQLAPEDKVAVMTTWIEEGDEPTKPLTKIRTISDYTSDRARTINALRDIPKLLGEQESLLEKIVADSGIGKWQIELVWSLSEVAETVMSQDAARRNRQFIVAGLIDDLFELQKGERQAVAETSARAGITFYGLVYKKSFVGNLFFGTLNQIVMRPSGKNLHAANYLAEQTGGQVMSVGRPVDLASGLEKVIADLASRYSLGFALGDNEADDGRMHRLEVRVEARDVRGKKRNLKTRFRQSYFVPEVEK